MRPLGARAFGAASDSLSIRGKRVLMPTGLSNIPSLGRKWKACKKKFIGVLARANVQLGTRALCYVSN